jgi:hypothetical protein
MLFDGVSVLLGISQHGIMVLVGLQLILFNFDVKAVDFLPQGLHLFNLLLGMRLKCLELMITLLKFLLQGIDLFLKLGVVGGLLHPVSLQLLLDVAFNLREEILNDILSCIVKDLFSDHCVVLSFLVNQILELEYLVLDFVELLLGCIRHSSDGVIEFFFLSVLIDFVHHHLFFFGLESVLDALHLHSEDVFDLELQTDSVIVNTI